MKKKLLALLCVLSVLIGVVALSATAAVPAAGKFSAGYAKVDITPYFYDDAGNFTDAAGNKVTSGIVMPVPLRGMGPSAKRLAYEYKTNDSGDYEMNADGTYKKDADGNKIPIVDANDGLFTSCIAVTDSQGSTVLFIAVDAIGDMRGFDSTGKSLNGYMTDARTAITAATGIPADHIMITASHAHGGVDLDVLNDSSVKALKDLDTANAVEVVMADKTSKYYVGDNVDTNGDGIITTGDTVNEYLQTWRDRLIQNLVKVSQNAIADQAVATVKKGSIEATDAAGTDSGGRPRVMNTVRHYIGTDTRNNNQNYVSGDNCNIAPNELDQFTDAKGNNYAEGTFVDQVSDVDQTLHTISFTFTDSTKKPIVLVNWRCHPSLNSGMTGEANRVLTSDYVNSFRYQMEKAGYRASFYQGAGGNNNPTSNVGNEGAWLKNYAKANCGRGNPYGAALAEVVQTCLNTKMQTVTTDKIQVMHQVYDGVLRKYDAAEIRGAKAAQTAADNGTWDTTALNPYFYTEGGKVYGFASVNHAKTAIRQSAMTQIKMEINTLLLGPNIAIVTCPGEAFDRYSLEAEAEIEALCGHDLNLNGSDTVAQYTAIANKYNDWNKLNLYNASTNPAGIRNAQYGEPLIFGYTNQYWNYIPNALAYTYNAVEPETYVVGSYETYLTPLAQGEGERMVANLAAMMDEMVNGETAYCQHCGKNATWYSMNASGTDAAYDHYYLSGDYNVPAQIQWTGKTVCLDLRGYTLTNTEKRLAALYSASTLSIMDTSTGATGQVIGKADGATGGTIWVDDSTLNIYGGTFSADNTSANAAYGGVIYVNKGTVNVYDGKIVGGNANNKGGAICLADSSSNLNVYGGEITAGSATLGGDCIASRNSDGIVSVAADAKVADICYLTAPTASNFKIVDSPADSDAQTPFAGSVTLNANGITHGAIVGSVSVPWAKGAAVTVSSGYDVVMNKNNQLVAEESFVGAAGVVLNEEITGYDTLAEAIANVGEGYVILGADVRNLTISSDITVDLNGKKITYATASKGATLTLMDSKTADCFIGDQIYGSVKNTSGTVVAADHYMPIKETTGTSYHRYKMNLSEVVLRPGRNGIYYKSEFDGDAMVKAKVESFGTALRIGKAPDANSMNPGTYSAFAPEDFGGESNSVILVDIMKSSNIVSTNKHNATSKVYGSPYIKLTDGTYLFGDVNEEHAYSLKTLTEKVSKTYSVEELKENADLMEMYRRFSAAMSDWDIQNIRDAYAANQAVETEALKVLLIGNSHSLDSFHLLYDVIEAEGIPENNKYGAKSVELGVLYYGGCRMRKHAEYAKGDVAAYDFYQVGPSTNGEWVKTPETTMKTGLLAVKWDIVVLQEMSMEECVFVNTTTNVAVNSTQYVYNYIRETLGYTPEFKWNMVWSNPTIPDCCDTTNYTTDADYMTKWIYKIARPAYAGQLDGYYSWEDRAMAFYQNDPQKQYNKMVEYLQDHIIGHYGIANEEAVVAPGTTMLYAIKNLNLSGNTGTAAQQLLADEQFSYRDYTHLSDVSRVMVSYLWYAELFGLDQIDSLAYTTVPAAMRAKDQSADVILDKNMQSNIIQAVNYTLDNRFGMVK